MGKNLIQQRRGKGSIFSSLKHQQKGEAKHIEEGEKKVIQIEQREIPKVKAEFDRYKEMCDQFDINPTEELCTQFLDEANNNLELVRENAEALESKGIIEQIRMQLHDLRKAERVYENLQIRCEGIE